MARLTIRLLGSFQANIGARPVIKFDSNKVRALLAYLAVECDQAQRREKLAALFWPEMAENRARSNLSQALYNLRTILQDQENRNPFFLVTRDAVQFNRTIETWLDVHTFSELVGENKMHNPLNPENRDQNLDRLQEAVDLYRGDFLEGFSIEGSLAFDEWCLLVRQRLHIHALDALHTLVEAYTRRGEIDQALPYALRQVELDPIRESAARQLMQLFLESGHRNQALAQFQRLSVLLAEELDVEPEQGTVDLYQRILAEGGASEQPEYRRHNLPAFLTPLVGRADELAELHEQLGDPAIRLLTILGPGGSGKTRLALESARSNLKTFNHGVFFVPLNPVQSTVSILPAVVEGVGLPLSGEGNIQEQLTDYLRNKNILLVLDGFEHLLDGAGVFVEILHQASGVKVLVTSRARLNIKGENLYNLEGMHYPVGKASESSILEADAVQLFISGMGRVRQEYQPTNDDLGHMLQVCQQVEGMPLGILLASSWGAAMSMSEISAEARRGLDFLSAEWSDVPVRQRSVRATFEYSWDLLEAHERELFQGLSVFRGGFSHRAAREVLGASPFELRTLVDKTLLLSKSSGRYEMHELLRQYGNEKLSESPADERGSRLKHSNYFLRRLERLGRMIKSAQQEAALAEIDVDHENFHTAWYWMVSKGDNPDLVSALEALCLYYDLRWRSQEGEAACCAGVDGLERFENSIEVTRTRIRMLAWQSHFQRLQGELESANQLLDECQVLLETLDADGYDTCQEQAFILFERGECDFNFDRDAAVGYYERSMDVYRDVEDVWGVAKALASLGLVAHQMGAFERGVQCYTECLELHRRMGIPGASPTP